MTTSSELNNQKTKKTGFGPDQPERMRGTPRMPGVELRELGGDSAGGVWHE
jgi:hypothetical protein